MSRTPLPSALVGRLVAVLRAPTADQLVPVCRTLAGAGIAGIELTLTTPDALDALVDVRAALPGIPIGLGTITAAEEVQAAAEAGAEFGVSPVMSTEVLDAAVAHRLPFVCGALTPTEVHAAWSAGASAVKIFPAGAVGPSYLGQLRGPFPGLAVMPSGGVGIEEIPRWFAAGATAVSLGGDLQGAVFEDGDLVALAERASRAAQLASGTGA